jgi:hypothetical protein
MAYGREEKECMALELGECDFVVSLALRNLRARGETFRKLSEGTLRRFARSEEGQAMVAARKRNSLARVLDLAETVNALREKVEVLEDRLGRIERGGNAWSTGQVTAQGLSAEFKSRVGW